MSCLNDIFRSIEYIHYIKTLPDMLELKKLNEIILVNMGTNEATIPDELKALIKHW